MIWVKTPAIPVALEPGIKSMAFSDQDRGIAFIDAAGFKIT
jgi:hypothetical protein